MFEENFWLKVLNYSVNYNKLQQKKLLIVAINIISTFTRLKWLRLVYIKLMIVCHEECHLCQIVNSGIPLMLNSCNFIKASIS